MTTKLPPGPSGPANPPPSGFQESTSKWVPQFCDVTISKLCSSGGRTTAPCLLGEIGICVNPSVHDTTVQRVCTVPALHVQDLQHFPFTAPVRHGGVRGVEDYGCTLVHITHRVCGRCFTLVADVSSLQGSTLVRSVCYGLPAHWCGTRICAHRCENPVDSRDRARVRSPVKHKSRVHWNPSLSRPLGRAASTGTFRCQAHWGTLRPLGRSRPLGRGFATAYSRVHGDAQVLRT